MEDIKIETITGKKVDPKDVRKYNLAELIFVVPFTAFMKSISNSNIRDTASFLKNLDFSKLDFSSLLCFQSVQFNNQKIRIGQLGKVLIESTIKYNEILKQDNTNSKIIRYLGMDNIKKFQNIFITTNPELKDFVYSTIYGISLFPLLRVYVTIDLYFKELQGEIPNTFKLFENEWSKLKPDFRDSIFSDQIQDSFVYSQTLSNGIIEMLKIFMNVMEILKTKMGNNELIDSYGSIVHTLQSYELISVSDKQKTINSKEYSEQIFATKDNPTLNKIAIRDVFIKNVFIKLCRITNLDYFQKGMIDCTGLTQYGEITKQINDILDILDNLFKNEFNYAYFKDEEIEEMINTLKRNGIYEDVENKISMTEKFRIKHMISGILQSIDNKKNILTLSENQISSIYKYYNHVYNSNFIYNDDQEITDNVKTFINNELLVIKNEKLRFDFDQFELEIPENYQTYQDRRQYIIDCVKNCSVKKKVEKMEIDTEETILKTQPKERPTQEVLPPSIDTKREQELLSNVEKFIESKKRNNDQYKNSSKIVATEAPVVPVVPVVPLVTKAPGVPGVPVVPDYLEVGDDLLDAVMHEQEKEAESKKINDTTMEESEYIEAFELRDEIVKKLDEISNDDQLDTLKNDYMKYFDNQNTSSDFIKYINIDENIVSSVNTIKKLKDILSNLNVELSKSNIVLESKPDNFVYNENADIEDIIAKQEQSSSPLDADMDPIEKEMSSPETSVENQSLFEPQDSIKSSSSVTPIDAEMDTVKKEMTSSPIDAEMEQTEKENKILQESIKNSVEKMTLFHNDLIDTKKEKYEFRIKSIIDSIKGTNQDKFEQLDDTINQIILDIQKDIQIQRLESIQNEIEKEVEILNENVEKLKHQYKKLPKKNIYKKEIDTVIFDIKQYKFLIQDIKDTGKNIDNFEQSIDEIQKKKSSLKDINSITGIINDIYNRITKDLDSFEQQKVIENDKRKEITRKNSEIEKQLNDLIQKIIDSKAILDKYYNSLTKQEKKKYQESIKKINDFTGYKQLLEKVQKLNILKDNIKDIESDFNEITSTFNTIKPEIDNMIIFINNLSIEIEDYINKKKEKQEALKQKKQEALKQKKQQALEKEEQIFLQRQQQEAIKEQSRKDSERIRLENERKQQEMEKKYRLLQDEIEKLRKQRGLNENYTYSNLKDKLYEDIILKKNEKNEKMILDKLNSFMDKKFNDLDDALIYYIIGNSVNIESITSFNNVIENIDYYEIAEKELFKFMLYNLNNDIDNNDNYFKSFRESGEITIDTLHFYSEYVKNDNFLNLYKNYPNIQNLSYNYNLNNKQNRYEILKDIYDYLNIRNINPSVKKLYEILKENLGDKYINDNLSANIQQYKNMLISTEKNNFIEYLTNNTVLSSDQILNMKFDRDMDKQQIAFKLNNEYIQTIIKENYINNNYFRVLLESVGNTNDISIFNVNNFNSFISDKKFVFFFNFLNNIQPLKTLTDFNQEYVMIFEQANSVLMKFDFVLDINNILFSLRSKINEMCVTYKLDCTNYKENEFDFQYHLNYLNESNNFILGSLNNTLNSIYKRLNIEMLQEPLQSFRQFDLKIQELKNNIGIEELYYNDLVYLENEIVKFYFIKKMFGSITPMNDLFQVIINKIIDNNNVLDDIFITFINNVNGDEYMSQLYFLFEQVHDNYDYDYSKPFEYKRLIFDAYTLINYRYPDVYEKYDQEKNVMDNFITPMYNFLKRKFKDYPQNIQSLEEMCDHYDFDSSTSGKNLTDYMKYFTQVYDNTNLDLNVYVTKNANIYKFKQNIFSNLLVKTSNIYRDDIKNLLIEAFSNESIFVEKISSLLNTATIFEKLKYHYYNFIINENTPDETKEQYSLVFEEIRDYFLNKDNTLRDVRYVHDLTDSGFLVKTIGYLSGIDIPEQGVGDLVKVVYDDIREKTKTNDIYPEQRIIGNLDQIFFHPIINFIQGKGVTNYDPNVNDLSYHLEVYKDIYKNVIDKNIIQIIGQLNTKYTYFLDNIYFYIDRSSTQSKNKSYEIRTKFLTVINNLYGLSSNESDIFNINNEILMSFSRVFGRKVTSLPSLINLFNNTVYSKFNNLSVEGLTKKHLYDIENIFEHSFTFKYLYKYYHLYDTNDINELVKKIYGSIVEKYKFSPEYLDIDSVKKINNGISSYDTIDTYNTIFKDQFIDLYNKLTNGREYQLDYDIYKGIYPLHFYEELISTVIRFNNLNKNSKLKLDEYYLEERYNINFDQFKNSFNLMKKEPILIFKSFYENFNYKSFVTGIQNQTAKDFINEFINDKQIQLLEITDAGVPPAPEIQEKIALTLREAEEILMS